MRIVISPQVLGAYRVPKLQGQQGVTVPLLYMLDSLVENISNVIAKEMIACLTELEQNLVYFLAIVCVEIGQQNVEGLVAAICILEQASKKYDTIPNCSEGSFCDISLLPQAQEQAAQYLLAVLIGYIAADSLYLLADVAEGGYGGSLDINIGMHRIPG